MTSRRYTVENLLTALRNPRELVRETERLLARLRFQARHGSGRRVTDEDWDNLLILDACRLDYFDRYNQMGGTLRPFVSKGSNSRDFIDANFRGRSLHDTVLVTANPYVERLSNDVFFEVYYAELFEDWDKDLRTIPPGAVLEATVEMHDRYPDKRLIAHFMQPHVPYIGPKGRELHRKYEFGKFNANVAPGPDTNIPDANIPQAVAEGMVSEAQLREAYAENVRIAIDHAERLIERLDGKSVITADHGEMLGERLVWSKQYGHGSLWTPELRIVPWFVVDAAERREVTEGEPSGFERLEKPTREQRLNALGYV